MYMTKKKGGKGGRPRIGRTLPRSFECPARSYSLLDDFHRRQRPPLWSKGRHDVAGALILRRVVLWRRVIQRLAVSEHGRAELGQPFWLHGCHIFMAKKS